VAELEQESVGPLHRENLPSEHEGPDLPTKRNRTVKTCGVALIEMLKARGIDHVFGIPGVHTVEL